jgi:hypothetical protein
VIHVSHSRQQDSPAQRIELRAAIALTFDELQPIDRPFYLPVAPLGGESRENRCVIPSNAIDKGLEGGDTHRPVEPVVQGLAQTQANDADELLDQFQEGQQGWQMFSNQRKELALFFRPVSDRLEEDPGQGTGCQNGLLWISP